MDPSTNFVRSHVSTTSQMSQAFGSAEDGTSPDQNHQQKHGPFEKDIGVHYAYAATAFIFELKILEHTPYLDQQQASIEELPSSIFQPPKIS